VSVMVAAVLASWPVMVGVIKVGVASQPEADAERYRCERWLAGSSNGYQCGLDWELSSSLSLSQNSVKHALKTFTDHYSGRRRAIGMVPVSGRLDDSLQTK